ncbi:hypothetical protein I317_01937 [Kwoniella heveanensis CBS 569]|nr:hypothetical protein I317_01937 [Kwoniella heveanensis CBS 569]
MAAPLPSPSGTSIRSSRPAIPLLSLAPPALALGDELAVGEPGDDNNAGEIWNVITRAADLVKDGERLENLAWRHWGQPRRGNPSGLDNRRLSTSSAGTASTASLQTPIDPCPALHRTRSSERLTFGGALRLLLEKDENNFKDWVEDAKKHCPPPPPPPASAAPTLSLPDTPIANVEIRLVEPTPVPSRVGSLGGSMNASGLLTSSATIPPALKEDVEEERKAERESKVRIAPIQTPSSRSGSPKKKGKFFVQSSLGKGSGSDSSHPSPNPPSTTTIVPTLLPNSKHHPRRRSSGDSSTGAPKAAKVDLHPPPQRRHVSLSTMRGKYQAEKRRMAENLAKDQANQDKDNEESGWEDEDEDEDEEDWSDDDEDKPETKGKESVRQHQPQPQLKEEKEKSEQEEPERRGKEQPNRRRSTSRPRPPARSTSGDQYDLAALLTRRPSQHGRAHHGQRDAPPPPAPTPLTKMSKRERQRAAAERAQIEAQLEAQRQREMFAKQQIFGNRPTQGLLASALQRGASMVNLHSALDQQPSLRSSPTHGQLPSLARSPAPGPSLLRSKSVVAMPVQTGVSVTVPPHALENAKGASHTSKGSQNSKKGGSSQEKAKAAAELESSDEESNDDANYLNTTQTKQKLAALAAKRDAKTQAQAQHQSPPAIAPATSTQAQALPAGPRLNEYGVVTPMSPTTRRRNIIMAEMSESLRRNVVLEREKSSGGVRGSGGAATRVRPPPSTHTSRLPTHSSAVNLTQYARGEPLERHNSHPTRGSHDTSQPSSHTGAMAPPPPPPPDPQRRRTTPNILAGGNFLRPLTRVPALAQPQLSAQEQVLSRSQARSHGGNHTTFPHPSQVVAFAEPRSGPSPTFERTQSTTNLNFVASPSNASPALEAPAMMRRSTDGDGLHKERERRKELARRRDTTDTSYRLHGW